MLPDTESSNSPKWARTKTAAYMNIESQIAVISINNKINSSDLRIKTSEPLAFEFITLTDRPASQKNDFSYQVRSHAMQSFLHQKKTAKSNLETLKPPAKTSSESKTPGQLSGKFKLATWSRKPRKKIGKQNPPKTGQGLKKRTETVKKSDEDHTGIGKVEVEPDKMTSLTYALHPYSDSLPISLEVTSTKQLLYHYNTGFKVNSFAINFDNAWKPFSFTDAALLHAILSIVAQHQDLVRGTEDSSDNLWHKGEVMRLMNGRLREPGRVVTGADITSVALLAIVESISGTYEASSAHRIGLKRMVDVHDGYWSLQHQPVILRVLAWADIVYSIRFGTRPTFPLLFTSLSPFTGSLAHTIPDQPSHLIPIVTFSSLSVQRLLQTLRNINYAVDRPLLYLSLPDRRAISDALHVTELQILASEHNVPSFCLGMDITAHSQLEVEEAEFGDRGRYRDVEKDVSALARAFTLSTLLYLHLTIRELPSSSVLHGRLLAELLTILRGVTRDDLTSPCSMDILLWCIFVGCAITRDNAVRSEFIHLMFEAGPEMERMDLESVRERLEGVVWRSSICDPLLDAVWQRI